MTSCITRFKKVRAKNRIEESMMKKNLQESYLCSISVRPAG
jgi:hypothetical protein